MSRIEASPLQTEATPPPLRRVRDDVKDGVAVAVASAVASMALVLFATLLMKLVG